MVSRYTRPSTTGAWWNTRYLAWPCLGHQTFRHLYPNAQTTQNKKHANENAAQLTCPPQAPCKPASTKHAVPAPGHAHWVTQVGWVVASHGTVLRPAGTRLELAQGRAPEVALASLPTRKMQMPTRNLRACLRARSGVKIRPILEGNFCYPESLRCM